MSLAVLWCCLTLWFFDLPSHTTSIKLCGPADLRRSGFQALCFQASLSDSWHCLAIVAASLALWNSGLRAPLAHRLSSITLSTLGSLSRIVFYNMLLGQRHLKIRGLLFRIEAVCIEGSAGATKSSKYLFLLKQTIHAETLKN